MAKTNDGDTPKVSIPRGVARVTKQTSRLLLAAAKRKAKGK